MQDMDQKISQEMMEFIQAHPSCYHVADGLAQMLETNGFVRLYENERWELQAGRDYYVTVSYTHLTLPTTERV